MLAGPKQAKALVATWRARQKGARLAVGDGAARTVQRTRRTTIVTIVLQQGAGVGVARYVVAGRDATAPRAAQAYAELLAAQIAAALEESPWDALVGDALADGEVSRTEALKAFALAYGGLPGFPRTNGERDPAEGSLALRWIVRVLPELTPAQRAAVSKVIDEPLPEAAGKRSLEALTPDAVYQPIAEKFLQDYLPRIGYALPGGTLPFPIRVYRSTQNQWSKYGWAAADAAPVDATGKTVTSGAPVACRIRIFPIGLASTQQFKLFAVAHEVFHCIQFAILGNGWPYTADWILEGTPDWAASKILPSVPFEQAGDTYQTYLKTPTKPLFTRAYDAVGFLGAADAVTGDLWPRMRDIVAGSSASAFAAAGGQSRAFLEVWASYHLRLDPSQPAWYQPRPWSVSTGKVSTPKTPVSANATLQAPAYANRLASVVVPAKKPFVTIDVTNGPGRLSDAQGDFVLDPGVRSFCVRGGCVCPPDEEGDFPPHEDVNNVFALALTGAESGSKLTISFKGIKEFCRKTDRRPPARPPGSPGGSNGDPHLTSLDGLRYDFQAAGEFVLVRSTSGDLEVQARQEPWGKSKWVTINTQLGFRVAGKKITVAAGDPPTTTVAGKALAAGATAPVGGGAVSRDEDGTTTITWPDGSEATVWGVGAYGVAVKLTLATARAGKVRGLLGNLDGKVTNDLVSRGGKALAYQLEDTASYVSSARVRNPDGKAFFDGLYDVVGESWRIDQKDSLLAYGPGQTTATFTDRSIPTRPIDQDALRAAARARAEQICRDAGVTDPVLLEDCILDVALTGDEAFAAAAEREQALVAVDWRRLAFGADASGTLALARTPDGALTLAVQERPVGAPARIGAVSVAADGTEGAPSLVSALDSTPSLAVTPAGGLLALAALLDGDAKAEGVFQFPAGSPFVAWGPRQHVATGGFTYVGVPVAAFAPDGSQLTVSGMNGANVRVFRGIPTPPLPVPTPFSAPIEDLPDCYASSPGIASDGAEVWLAWTQWDRDCPQHGLYVAQVDPAQVGTPAGIVAATRTLAPDSFWPGLSIIDYPDLSLDDHVAIVSRPGQAGVFVAYRSFVGSRWRVLLWRIGTPAPIEVWSGTRAPGRISLTAEPTTGKLWLAWVDEDGRLDVRRTDAAATGFETPVRNVERADDAAPFGEWQVSARDGGLDVVYQVDRAGDTPGGIWLGTVTG
ncbi:MAG: VWD domain-containing protein [Thermoleophilia bacterium]